MESTLDLIKKSQKGDKLATEQIVKQNMGLVWSVVKKFGNRGYELDDLYQIGCIGLLKCIQKFDSSFNVQFSTYAVPMIMGEIKRFLRDDGMIKISRPVKELSIRARYTQERMTKEQRKEPTISQLAEELEVTVDELVFAMNANRDVESIYQTVGGDDNNQTFLIDKLVFHKDNSNSLIDKITLQEIISQLNSKERQVILLRYFEDKTQSEIAKQIGVSQVQVSRIEKKVLKIMRESMKE